MLEVFYPHRYEVSAYVTPSDYYHVQRVQGMIFDIGNALVPHDTPTDGQTVKLFERLCAVGMRTCLPSNNKKPRVRFFTDLMGSCYIHKTGKPEIRGYEKIMGLMGTNRNHTLFVGGQLLTNICGASRAGIYNTLVRSTDSKEEIQIVLKRYPEKPVLHLYKKHARGVSQDRE